MTSRRHVAVIPGHGTVGTPPEAATEVATVPNRRLRTVGDRRRSGELDGVEHFGPPPNAEVRQAP
jgi:hypothetical protein